MNRLDDISSKEIIKEHFIKDNKLYLKGPSVIRCPFGEKKLDYEFAGMFYIEIKRLKKETTNFRSTDADFQIVRSVFLRHQNGIRRELIQGRPLFGKTIGNLNGDWNIDDRVYLLIYNDEVVGYEFSLDNFDQKLDYVKLTLCENTSCSLKIWFDRSSISEKLVDGEVEILLLNGESDKYKFNIFTERKILSITPRMFLFRNRPVEEILFGSNETVYPISSIPDLPISSIIIN